MKKSILYSAMALSLGMSANANALEFLYDAGGKFNQNKVNKVVANAGGSVLDCIEEISVCKVEFSTLEAAKSSGLNVVPNASAFIPKIENVPVGAQLTVAEDYLNPPNSADDDFLFDLQWGHQAVGAVEAWNAGNRGKGVRVAVIDSGADGGHPDLAPNINIELSRSFVPEETWDYAGPDSFNHGSHTAGTIAAADNGFGTIGVAPEAELVILKALSADTGSGDSYGTMQAMVYAANIGADVANMSLGLSVRRNGLYDIEGTPYDTSDDIQFETASIAQFIQTYGKAANYAKQNGVTLIASAGNEGTDLDHSDSLMKLPADLPAVNSISALGPRLWGKDSATFTDHLAIYSNYGQSAIDFAAPGGDYTSAFMSGGFDACNVAGLVRPCYVFDFVFSTGNGGWYWSVGTSMSAPHAAGVAALIIGANGGNMNPTHVEAKLRELAEDMGKPGRDDVYGHGKVQAPK
ncbi:S8 family peptidase [Thalassotalea mangrovi]|uniref:Peptidase S8/S53 subtilisin kexin sedolisin n=1 Tax=Thalassotalea mangrovi TaxID=2572245 RepID=A0A4U1B4D2_9GAMM|nr:S8 family serine peptidase [Thalassotalea mangrovi]TKB44214.1 peptidase S8/S53 subtilisin kexin sedolisin [Thalassotalea mangrovi]